jgi:uncharacterized protein (DUF1330 family)
MPTSSGWIEPYLAEVTPLVRKHGGRYLARAAAYQLPQGEGGAALVVILEWPTREAEAAFHSDPASAGPLRARLAGSASRRCSVEGKDDFAQ